MPTVIQVDELRMVDRLTRRFRQIADLPSFRQAIG